MMPAQAVAPGYDARIRRARFLASAQPFAAEVLTFYERLAEFQKTLYDKISHRRAGASRPNAALTPFDKHFRSEQSLEMLFPHFPEFLSLLEKTAPSAVIQAARRFAAQPPADWAASLNNFWTLGALSDAPEPLNEFIFRAFLQPYSEFLAERMASPQLDATSRLCPRCGSRALLGVLRPEGDGGKRFLMCSFCLQEWEFRRILCPACGEEDEKQLPVYVAEQFPYIRVEACDTCKCYLRTIDLTKNGHAVPLVDDLGALPLTLWAHEHSYTRLQQNLLGT